MANRTRFAAFINANDFSYGGAGIQNASALQVYQGNSVTGVGTVTLAYGQIGLTDGTNLAPLNVNAPITVGVGTNAETVTPTAVSNATPGIYGSPTITANFANIHGYGDQITSGTFGLQEAVNFAAAQGSGTVIIDQAWYNSGGTAAIIAAATIPNTVASGVTQQTGEVRIFDQTTFTYFGNRISSNTLLVAPTIPLVSQVASQTGVVGTWTAVTTYVNFLYVDAKGGITAASSQYSFTATVSLAIGGSGPIAETGAVGYLVALGTTTTTYIAPATSANGTVIVCGGVPCFPIGTPFSVATATTSALPVVPVQASAYVNAVLPVSSSNMLQPFNTVWPVFQATGVVTAGTAIEAARFDIPAGFLNSLGRTLRIKFTASYTPVSTATLIPSLLLYSVYGVTSTTLWTVTTPATSGTASANMFGEILLTTSATGTAGTFEGHGFINYGGATATTGLLVSAGDAIHAASSAANLVKQDTFSLTINSGTANLTQFQVREITIEVLQ